MIKDRREYAEATEELRAAVDWYEDQEPGLGDKVLRAAELAVKAIIEYPQAWPILPGWGDRTPVIRTHGLATFHYRVVYYVKDDTLNIIAYAHANREPEYWSHRLESDEPEG